MGVADSLLRAVTAASNCWRTTAPAHATSHRPPPLAHPNAQLDLGLIERLQKDWLEGTLAAQREERRRHDRKAAEYDAAR